MIISHKHRFIFVKSKKTAGTSVEVHLSQFCGDNDIVTPIIPPIAAHQPRNFKSSFNPLPEIADLTSRGRIDQLRKTWRHFAKSQAFYNHIPAWLIRARIPSSVWRNYFKFTIERNPWDKTISHYHMLRSRRNKDMTLDDYLANGEFCVNLPWYTEPRNPSLVIVDRIIRYEYLDRDLHEISDVLGLPFSGKLEVRAKSDLRTDRRHYREIFSESQREFVREVFREEIALHRYSF